MLKTSLYSVYAYKHIYFLYLDTRIEIFEDPLFRVIFFEDHPLFGVEISKDPPGATFAGGST